jgi:hypothetical protein
MNAVLNFFTYISAEICPFSQFRSSRPGKLSSTLNTSTCYKNSTRFPSRSTTHVRLMSAASFSPFSCLKIMSQKRKNSLEKVYLGLFPRLVNEISLELIMIIANEDDDRNKAEFSFLFIFHLEWQ